MDDDLENMTDEQKREWLAELRKKPPCPYCSGFTGKAWHPEGWCPSEKVTRQ